MSLLRDHQGKASSTRFAAFFGMVIAAILATAPLWGGPPASIETLAIFIVGPGGLKVWQSVSGKD